jgi:hypothetical protein
MLFDGRPFRRRNFAVQVGDEHLLQFAVFQTAAPPSPVVVCHVFLRLNRMRLRYLERRSQVDKNRLTLLESVSPMLFTRSS